MKKRILSIVLAVAMLATLVPMGIFASAESTAQLAAELTISDTIDSVNVLGYVAPTAGADIAESLAGLTVPEGAHYSISSACWYNETLDNFCTDGSFIAGYTYRLSVDVFVDSGYFFADELVMQFNGDASLVDRDFYYCYADAEYAYLYSVATQLEGELITVDTVNVNGYVAPTAGADIDENLAGLSVPEGAPYSISEPYWYNETLDRNERYGTFIAGYTYRLRVSIRVASGCVFADDIVMQLNGDASLVDLGNSRFGKASVRLFSVDTQLEGELITVDTVNVNGYIAPTVGADIAENLAGLTAPDGAPYSINPFWYNETLDSFCTEGTFIAGYTYRLNVDIYVDSGYVFADDLVMQFNGDASLVDRDFGYCYSEPGDAYLYSVATELSAEGGDDPAESTVIDTINVNGYVAPTVGASLADALANLSVPADAPYSIIDAYWFNDTLDDYESGETFVAGYSYSLGVEIKFADGYVLADEYTVQFNGDASLCDPLYILEGNENTDYGLRFFSVSTTLPAEGGDTPTDSIPVDLVNFNGYVAPTVGASIADSLAGLSVPTDAPYSIAELHWLDETTGEMLTEGTFLAGHSYSLGVAFNLADGYALAEEPTFQLNGDATLVNPLASGAGDEFGFDFFYYSVSTELPSDGGDTPIEPTEKTEIDSVDVSGITAPTHGQSVGDYKASLTLVLPEGANYSVRSITITEINPETLGVIDMLADGDVFDSSKTYSVGILVEAGDGYVFATDAVITANGGEYEPIMTLSDGDKAGVAVAFTPAEGGDEPTEPTEKTEIDKIDVSGITAPMRGQTVVDYKTGFVPVLPDGANYTFGAISWIEIDPETMTPTTGESLADDYVFDSAKLYAIVFTVYPAEGYAFAEDAVITANGGNAEIYNSVVRSDFAYIAVTLTPDKGVDEPIVIDTINVNGYVAPTVGAAVIDPMTFLSVPADAPYSIVDAYWHDDTVLDFVTEGTFLAGHIYALGVVIVPDEGYVFADELTLMFNGDANLVDAEYTDAYSYSVEYWTLVTDLSAEGGDEPTEKTEIDKIEISGITAPEYGKTVADYKASFVPVLPEGANYTFDIIEWAELNPETMAAVSTQMLADDHVFDASKIYSAMIAIKANDGYVFADDAVITINGGDLEVFKFMPIENQAVIAIAFNPDTKPVEIDKIEISGITAPEYGKTVADYKASFVPVLPEGANYTLAIIAWTELDPETMTPVSTEVLADDYVFDSTKTYGVVIGIRANEGYVFAGDAEITANGGKLEIFESMAIKDQALIAIVFNSAPDTGDSSTIAVFAIVALASIGCVALTLRKKED